MRAVLLPAEVLCIEPGKKQVDQPARSKPPRRETAGEPARRVPGRTWSAGGRGRPGSLRWFSQAARASPASPHTAPTGGLRGPDPETVLLFRIWGGMS